MKTSAQMKMEKIKTSAFTPPGLTIITSWLAINNDGCVPLGTGGENKNAHR